jgi:hypothetical protein
MPDTPPPQSSIILYQTEDGRTRIQCRFEDETIWLTQALIAELFQITVPTVNEHLKGIFTEGEPAPEPTIREFRIVRSEGARQVSREIEHYSLPAIAEDEACERATCKEFLQVRQLSCPEIPNNWPGIHQYLSLQIIETSL